MKVSCIIMVSIAARIGGKRGEKTGMSREYRDTRDKRHWQGKFHMGPLDPSYL